MTVGAVVPAAGAGARLGRGIPKALQLVAGEPLVVHAVRGLRACPGIGPIVVAAPAAMCSQVAELLRELAVVVVEGGADRRASVALALAALPAEVDQVLVHDAARAFAPVAVVEGVLAALSAGATAVVPVLELADTVKEVDDGGLVVTTVPRIRLRAVQTPQGFRRTVLEQAHQDAAGDATDDAGLVEAAGGAVRTVPGSPEAFKVTTAFDLMVAEALLAQRAAQ